MSSFADVWALFARVDAALLVPSVAITRCVSQVHNIDNLSADEQVIRMKEHVQCGTRRELVNVMHHWFVLILLRRAGNNKAACDECYTKLSPKSRKDSTVRKLRMRMKRGCILLAHMLIHGGEPSVLTGYLENLHFPWTTVVQLGDKAMLDDRFWPMLQQLNQTNSQESINKYQSELSSPPTSLSAPQSISNTNDADEKEGSNNSDKEKDSDEPRKKSRRIAAQREKASYIDAVGPGTRRPRRKKPTAESDEDDEDQEHKDGAGGAEDGTDDEQEAERVLNEFLIRFEKTPLVRTIRQNLGRAVSADSASTPVHQSLSSLTLSPSTVSSSPSEAGSVLSSPARFLPSTTDIVGLPDDEIDRLTKLLKAERKARKRRATAEAVVVTTDEEEEDADETPVPRPKRLQVQIPETNYWIQTPVADVASQQQQQPFVYAQLSEHSNEPSPALPSMARNLDLFAVDLRLNEIQTL